MSETVNIRRERIERLLTELRYEIERGMLEREIDETLSFQFVVPISQAIPDGIVMCEFRTRPLPRGYLFSLNPDLQVEPRLRIVK